MNLLSITFKADKSDCLLPVESGSSSSRKPGAVLPDLVPGATIDAWRAAMHCVV